MRRACWAADPGTTDSCGQTVIQHVSYSTPSHSTVHSMPYLGRLGHTLQSHVKKATSSGTQLLLVLLVPSSTPFYLTTFMMLSMYGMVVRSFLAPLPLARSLLGIPCLVIAMLFLLWKLLPSLRLCVNTYIVLTVMPCTVLGQPHLLELSVALTITGLAPLT